MVAKYSRYAIVPRFSFNDAFEDKLKNDKNKSLQVSLYSTNTNHLDSSNQGEQTACENYTILFILKVGGSNLISPKNISIIKIVLVSNSTTNRCSLPLS